MVRPFETSGKSPSIVSILEGVGEEKMTSHTMQISLAIAIAALTAVVAGQSTCDLVEAQTSIELYRPLQLGYASEQSKYWSTACGDLRPSCILMPTTADEVAAIISILATNNENFAIKSGGHNPNNYFSSINGSPLISTKNLNQVVLDSGTGTVRVGPGNRWDDVSKALDGSGYSVVGGRIGNVGVGGYMLGGETVGG